MASSSFSNFLLAQILDWGPVQGIFPRKWATRLVLLTARFYNSRKTGKIITWEQVFFFCCAAKLPSIRQQCTHPPLVQTTDRRNLSTEDKAQAPALPPIRHPFGLRDRLPFCSYCPRRTVVVVAAVVVFVAVVVCRCHGRIKMAERPRVLHWPPTTTHTILKHRAAINVGHYFPHTYTNTIQSIRQNLVIFCYRNLLALLLLKKKLQRFFGFQMSAAVASSACTTLHVVFTHSIPEQLWIQPNS